MTPQEQAVMDGLVKALRARSAFTNAESSTPFVKWMTMERIVKVKESQAFAAYDALAQEPTPPQESFTHRFLAEFEEHKRDVQPYVYQSDPLYPDTSKMPQPREPMRFNPRTLGADGHFTDCPHHPDNGRFECTCKPRDRTPAETEAAITAVMSGPISEPSTGRFNSRWRDYGLEGEAGEEGYEHIRNVALRFYGLGRRDAETQAARKE